MTEENYDYRTSQSMLRNQFNGKGKLKIPIIPKFKVKPDDFDELLMIGFDKTNIEDRNHLDRMVHFFLYDYRFERVWKNPDSDIEMLSRYKAVLSPDFSMYIEMAPVMQMYNVFRNRWCGAYWASKGICVIPTVNWGNEDTFDFCFDGIEKGGVVAVSTYMASDHGNRKDQKEWFLKGYNEMLCRIEPEKIICYNTPFPEMEGDIVYVDYELSSWKYMNYERKSKYEDLDAYKMSGCVPNKYDTMTSYRIMAGGGSAYGGQWQPNPNKPEDQRFSGEPGEKKTTFSKRYRIDTKMDKSGRAIRERHYTDHGNPAGHTNPHDHDIKWDTPDGHPEPQGSINYPDGVPEFKSYEGMTKMGTIIQGNTPEQNRFITISDFKECMRYGGEVGFFWKGKTYDITHPDGRTIIYEAFKPETEKWCDTADEVLEYIVGGDRLRDVITQVTVLDRTI